MHGVPAAAPQTRVAHQEHQLDDHMSAFTELRARNNAGDEVSFDAFAGKVVLVVNVARL